MIFFLNQHLYIAVVMQINYYYYYTTSTNRMLTVQSSHVSTSSKTDADRYCTLISQLKVLCPDNWPDEPAASQRR